MKIEAQFDDEPEFIRQVELAVNGALHRYPPESFVLIKIDNWFGSRWLGFSGKALGALGLTIKPSYRNHKHLMIPPFVPERVLSQRRFIAPAFEEIDAGKPVHIHVPSRIALRRKVAVEEPNTALAWYSGKTKENGRGSLMVYLLVGDAYWAWFVELERKEPWRITEAREIKPDDFTRLMEEGTGSLTGSLT
jgi:hypothetical protein